MAHLCARPRQTVWRRPNWHFSQRLDCWLAEYCAIFGRKKVCVGYATIGHYAIPQAVAAVEVATETWERVNLSRALRNLRERARQFSREFVVFIDLVVVVARSCTCAQLTCGMLRNITHTHTNSLTRHILEDPPGNIHGHNARANERVLCWP